MRWIALFILMANGALFWVLSMEREETAKSEPVSALNGDRDLPSLTLLDEDAVAGDRAPPAAVTHGVSADSVRKPNPVSSHCLRMGPFVDKVSAKQVAFRLQSLDINGLVSAVERESEPTYWVYLPPRATRNLAMQTLKELQEKRIDSFLIGEGELANGISLGMYSQKVLATRLQQERIQQGYAAEVYVKKRTIAEYWVVLQPEYARLVSEELFLRIVEEYQDLKKEEKVCKPVAL